MGTTGTIGSFDATKADSITGSAQGEEETSQLQQNFDINKMQSLGTSLVTPNESNIRPLNNK